MKPYLDCHPASDSGHVLSVVYVVLKTAVVFIAVFLFSVPMIVNLSNTGTTVSNIARSLIVSPSIIRYPVQE